MQSAELDQLMEQIESKYRVETVPFKIGDKVLKTLQIQDYEEYLVELLEAKGVGIKDLPYWAKIWEASFVLAYFLGKQPVKEGRRILEIGAGVGIVGIYAALCGHRVTVTDINPDALLFAKANALLNGVSADIVQCLDWNDSNLSASYDVIVGSEVVYDRQTYPTLVHFLRSALAPGGMIFLAKNLSLHAPMFFAELAKYFELKHSVQTLRGGDEDEQVELYAIRPKADVIRSQELVH